MLAGLKACEQHLAKFGGHKMAAGLEVKPGEVEAFKGAFNEAAARMLRGVDLTEIQHVDAVVDAGELGWPFYEALRRLHPFGQDNPEPVLALKGVQTAAPPRTVGQKHLKLSFSAGNRVLEAIAFNYPRDQLPAGALDIAFTLKENHWNGHTSLQLQIQDIRPAD
jgi:single-stranded-DNA-specific exonuclease